MGVITEISSQKNKKRVNIFVDGVFVSGLSFESAVKNGLKTGLSITEQKLKSIIEESETQDCFTSGLNFLSKSAKTKHEIIQKLLQKGFERNIIELAVKKLEEYHYINDELYAMNFVKSYTGKSKRELQYKMKNKGIADEIINKVLVQIPEDHDFENAISYSNKYLKAKAFNEKTKNNLFAALVRRGFSLDIIYIVIENIKVGGNDDWC